MVIAPTTLLLSACLAAALLLRWMRQRHAKYYNLLDKLPGPRRWPIIGNVLDLRGGNDHILEILHVTWTRAYGEIYRVFVGSTCYVIITSPELFEPILNSTTIIAKKGRDYDQMVPWLGYGLLTSTGSKWKARRRLLTPAFHFQILEKFIETFDEQSRVLCRILSERSRPDRDNEMDIYPMLTRCALDIICEAAMGCRISAQTDDSEYVQAVYRITQIFNARFQRPWLDNDTVFGLTPLGREHNRLLKILHGFTDSVIECRREERTREVRLADADDQPKRRPALLDLLLEASEGGAQLSFHDIREEIDTFMFEGHDTVASAISWCLYCLASNPDHQERIWNELNDVFEGSDRDFTFHDVPRLKYLECCIKEALRLYPSVPAFARWLTEDIQIGKYQIPAQCSLVILPYATHRNARHFPDPLKFDPERFLFEQSVGRHPFAYIPFSAGPRNCIGQRFAMLEEKVVLSNLLRQFKFGLSANTEPPVVSDQITLKPLKGIFLTVCAR